MAAERQVVVTINNQSHSSVLNGQGRVIVTPLSTFTRLPANPITTSGTTIPQLSTQVVINRILLKAVSKGGGKEENTFSLRYLDMSTVCGCEELLRIG